MNQTRLREELERYVAHRYGAAARVCAVVALGKDAGEKGFGYGVPLRVTLSGASVEQVVIHTVGGGGFGHDTLADRAAAAVLAYETFNNLPHHVRALDVGVVDAGGIWRSLGDARDFFVVTEYAEGEPYFHDLERLAETDRLTETDLQRAERLAAYLAEIHADRKNAPELYRRRTRDLFGHHECIPGLLDSYDAFPLDEFTSAAQLREIERRCVDWRHRLKGFTHRLCRVHGDFHPWNVLFSRTPPPAPLLQGEGGLRSGEGFALLDRSRGEWGEAADDVSCMAINYLFFSLQAHGRLAGPLQELWQGFFETYLSATRDEELVQVIPPYFVWRALVLASPLWYPTLDTRVRRQLFGFIDQVLDGKAFDWRGVNALLE